MAVDYFLKIDGIKGESTDVKHEDEIDIHSFSFGESNDGSALDDQARQARHAGLQLRDGGSAGPHRPCSSRSPRASTSRRRSSRPARPVRRSSWSSSSGRCPTCIFTSYNEGGSAGDLVPLDQFSLNFTKIEIEYKTQKEDGSLDQTVRAGWDLAAKKAF